MSAPRNTATDSRRDGAIADGFDEVRLTSGDPIGGAEKRGVYAPFEPSGSAGGEALADESTADAFAALRADATAERLQEAVRRGQPLLVGTSAARRRQDDGVWCFVPYGSRSFAALEREPLLRLGMHASRPPVQLSSLPEDVLVAIARELDIPDFVRVGRLNRAFAAFFARHTNNTRWANRLVAFAQQRERTNPNEQGSSLGFVRRRMAPSLRLLVDRVEIFNCLRFPADRLAKLLPNVRTVDATVLDLCYPEYRIGLYDDLSVLTILPWTHIDRVDGHRAIAPALQCFSARRRVLRRLDEVGFERCYGPLGARLNILMHRGARITFATVAPWLKPTARREDPYFLLDLMGIEQLNVALCSVDGTGPSPDTWLSVYQWCHVLVGPGPAKWHLLGPAFFSRVTDGPMEFAPDWQERPPSLPAFSGDTEELRWKLSQTMAVMARSDGRTLLAWLRALSARLDGHHHEELQTATVGAALPFLSFASWTFPVLQLANIAPSFRKALMITILGWVDGASGDSVPARLQHIFARAPLLTIRLLDQNMSSEAKRDDHARSRNYTWRARPSRQEFSVAFWPAQRVANSSET